MSNNISQSTTLDDIIFKDKNREYGAFALRKDYPRIITKSLIVGVTSLALLYAASFAYDKLNEALKAGKTDIEATVIDIPPPPPKDKVVVPPPPPPPPPPPKELIKVATTRFLPPEIKPDEQVTKSEPPPEEIVGKVSSETVKGVIESEPTGDPDAAPAAPAAVEPPAPKEDEIFTAVEQNPEFPGGNKAFINFLSKYIEYPSEATENNIAGKVILRFTVNKDGSVEDIKVLKGVGFGCDEEAVRVLKMTPKWAPGKQSGRAVRVSYSVPIVFSLPTD